MRVVADSNIVVSGLLWRGYPRRILDLARCAEITLFTSTELLAELDDVLRRKKLARRLQLAGVAPSELVSGYAALARLVVPARIDPVVVDDPDDDAVIACAVAAQARFIVSGDGHLLNLRKAHGIRIVSARRLLGLATFVDAPEE
jgi:putative PIN family toxin of toxin-antitoxin system